MGGTLHQKVRQLFYRLEHQQDLAFKLECCAIIKSYMIHIPFSTWIIVTVACDKTVHNLYIFDELVRNSVY